MEVHAIQFETNASPVPAERPKSVETPTNAPNVRLRRRRSVLTDSINKACSCSNLHSSLNEVLLRSSNESTQNIDIRKSSGSDIEEVALCVCQQSQQYPLCDRTHETFNRETNSTLKPLRVRITKSVDRLSNDINTLNLDSKPDTLTITNVQPSTPNKTNMENEKTETPQPTPQPPPRRLEIRKIEDISKITAEYTLEEVAKHNTRDDCWIIVYDKVYDVTAYFEFHPGGTQALLNFAGKDATENVQYHSSKMLMLLNKYFYIGKLKTDKQESSCIIC